MIKKGMFTAIGSWPHKDLEKIINLIFDNFIYIPVWPQLPQLNFFENMYVQYSEGLPCIVIDENNEKIYFNTSNDFYNQIQNVYENFLSDNFEYFKISEKFACGLYSFKNKIKESKKLKLIKGQILGPVSLTLSLTDENKRIILYNEEITDAILKATLSKAIWQVNFLKDLAEQLIIFIDEPYLVSFGSAYINLTREQVITMLNEIIDKLHEHNVIVGVHCCGNTDWSILMETNIDILNFDAYNYFQSIKIYANKLNEFLKGKNHFLAWGIVPTNEEKIFEESPETILEKLNIEKNELIKLGVDENLINEKLIITPACGTGTISEKAAEHVIFLLRKISDYLK
ncbi:MAG TPA: hypothetical protein PLD27_02920 [bacterium]|nr:hypothetical protein [bacterium]HOL46962.1 hypothetical protein [bacterium]HPQ18227.1 hypothetical protein [bacterium]